MSRFTLPRDIYYGANALENLKNLKGSRAVLVLGGGSMKKFGFVDKALGYLKEAGIETRLIENVEPDPSVETVMSGAAVMREFEPDWIISMGGGSPIDAAKAMWAFYEYPETTFEDLITPFSFPELRQKARFCAIPSTSGTATEVTAFSVITDYQKGIKYPLADFNITPDVAIIDPALAETMPPKLVAHTGMDALTHAIEAYVSTGANDFSDALAEKAVRLVVEYLPWVYKHGDDMAAREHMHNASNMAGIAFNHASLGINHSIAHIVGGRFRIPHGRANAIVLPYVIEFNSRLGDRTHAADSMAAMKYSQLGVLIGGGSYAGPQAIRNLIITIEKMQAEFDIPSSLKKAGVDQQAFMSSVEELAEIAIQDKCTATNPRSVSKKRMVELLKRIYNGR